MGSRARYGRDCHSYNTELHLSEGGGRRLLVLCVFVSNQKRFKVHHVLFLLANVVKSVPSIVALAIDRDSDCRVIFFLLTSWTNEMEGVATFFRLVVNVNIA
jgi:hypothetical protein